MSNDDLEGEDSWSVAQDVPDADESSAADLSASQRLIPVGKGPREGEVFGGEFSIISRLGAGGMGVVFRAKDETSGRVVALKTLAERRMTGRQRTRFQREGELTATLSHPGIVKIHSSGEINGIPYLAYELVEGGQSIGDAFKIVERDVAVALLRDVADAVGYAHGKGVVHRDLKPDNVLVDEEGKARVADFGLALAEGQDRLTLTGALVGTPTYMAPEQFHSGLAEVGPATDVWALGVMLYVALTGELPFGGRSLIELAAAVAKAMPKAPREYDESIAVDLEAICLKALALMPADRYPNGTALAEDLSAALEERPVTASRVEWRWRRRKKSLWKWTAGAALVLCVVAAAAWRPSGGVTPEERRLRGVLTDFRRGTVDREVLEFELEQHAVTNTELKARVHLALAGGPSGSPDAWRVRLAYADAALSVTKDPALRALGWRARGRALLELEDYGLADEALTVAARDDPSPSLLLELGRARLEAGRGKSASEAAERLLALRPGAIEGLELLAQVQIALGLPAAAKETAAGCARAHPGPRSRILLGEVEAAFGEDPRPKLRQALREFPKHSGLRLAIATYVFEQEADVETAAWWVREASHKPGRLGRLSGVLAALLTSPIRLETVRAAPRKWRDAAALWLLRCAEREVGFLSRARQWPVRRAPGALSLAARRARAHEFVESCLALDPSDVGRLGRAHVALARLGPRAEGLVHLAAAEKLIPTSPWVLCLRAEERLEAGGPDQALVALGAGRSARGAAVPERRLALVEAKALVAKKEFERALEPLERLVGELRVDREALSLLVTVHEGLGRDPAPIRERLELLSGRDAALGRRIEDQDPGARSPEGDRLAWAKSYADAVPGSVDAHFEFGKELYKVGERVRGLREIAWAIQCDSRYLPRFSRFLEILAAATLLEEDLQFGETQLEDMKAGLQLSDDPIDRLVTAVLSVGIVEYHRLAEWSPIAARDLDLLLRDDPANVAARTMRGFIYLRAGLYPQAERELRIAEEEAPDCATVAFYQCLLHGARGERAKALAKIEVVRTLGFPPWRDQAWFKMHYPEMDVLRDTEGFAEFKR